MIKSFFVDYVVYHLCNNIITNDKQHATIIGSILNKINNKYIKNNIRY